ncbi:hypothetical protein CE91St41_36840 [Oscillospiraceae bacterium]|nr:hypothetical protein CE91St40_36820 [Oscillospiraceae bacterium]BDF76795.1 hypothetical protein CE91St41_36840 [Oscillospiraceae bacterium]
MSVEVNLIGAYNFRLLETILKSLHKYWAFTLNTEDYDEVFRLGKQGLLLRPTEEERAQMDYEIPHKLAQWSGIPLDFLYGERQIITGIYLEAELPPLNIKDFDHDSRRLDDRVYDIMSIREFDDLWADPLGLDEYISDDIFGSDVVAEHGMEMLLSALVFLLKRKERSDEAPSLGEVPSLSVRQNRRFQEYDPRLRALADILIKATGCHSSEAVTEVGKLEQDLSILHFGRPFEKLVCKLATATR